MKIEITATGRHNEDISLDVEAETLEIGLAAWLAAYSLDVDFLRDPPPGFEVHCTSGVTNERARVDSSAIDLAIMLMETS